MITSLNKHEQQCVAVGAVDCFSHFVSLVQANTVVKSTTGNSQNTAAVVFSSHSGVHHCTIKGSLVEKKNGNGNSNISSTQRKKVLMPSKCKGAAVSAVRLVCCVVTAADTDADTQLLAVDAQKQQ